LRKTAITEPPGGCIDDQRSNLVNDPSHRGDRTKGRFNTGWVPPRRGFPRHLRFRADSGRNTGSWSCVMQWPQPRRKASYFRDPCRLSLSYFAPTAHSGTLFETSDTLRSRLRALARARIWCELRRKMAVSQGVGSAM